jgi:superfamily II DNA/RNA helicase
MGPEFGPGNEQATVSIPFADLGIPAHLVAALAEDGLTEAFPIQAACIPQALAGQDICGRAKTGSGKTLAFGIPLMARIGRGEPHKPTGVILVPTRELAKQVQTELVSLGRATKHYILSVYGGVPYSGQVNSLRRGAALIVACPGRLLDLVERGDLRLDAVSVVVVDEADRMADMGFLPEVTKLLDMMPADRQTMLFSATLDGEVDELIRRYQNKPAKHDLVGDVKEQPAEQRWERVPIERRIERSVELIREFGPTMMFAHTRDGADQLVEDLENAGMKARGIHGGLNQARRERALESFKAGKVEVLVGTDVAARGIHVDNVGLVLQWDLPSNAKDYVHRAGRTARAGQAGVIVNLIAPHQEKKAKWLMSRVDPNGRLSGDAVSSGSRPSSQRPQRRERDERPRGDGGWQPRESRTNGWQPRQSRDERPRSDSGWQPRESRTEASPTDRAWQPERASSERSRSDMPKTPAAENRAARRAALQAAEAPRSPWQQQRTPTVETPSFRRDERSGTADAAQPAQPAQRSARQAAPTDGQPRRYAKDGVIDWQPRERKSGEYGPPGARRSYGAGPAAPASRRGAAPASSHRKGPRSTSIATGRSSFSRTR